MSTRRIKAKLRDVEALELTLANAKHPMFNSPHEGYAVIMEEVEEMQEQAGDISSVLAHLWESIRYNYPETAHQIDLLEEIALEVACEAVQAAAMARKFRLSFSGRGNGG